VDLGVALGLFLLGAGAGALTTFALNVKQIRQLQDLLKSKRNSQTREQECHEQNGRKSA